jgi:hypothetical protein
MFNGLGPRKFRQFGSSLEAQSAAGRDDKLRISAGRPRLLELLTDSTRATLMPSHLPRTASIHSGGN